MNDIKAGDLVMVVKPTTCCGGVDMIGSIFVVKKVLRGFGRCEACGNVSLVEVAFESDSYATDLPRLKKIDPPADGDSLPIRKDIEVPA